jgi:hypothetical protein
MRRILLISLSLFLVLVGWSTVYADDGFYVIAGQKAKYAPVPKTGQTTSYGTGSDGALQKGVAWPTPRFTDNGNGTVTDNLTRLIWMKNAEAIPKKNWADALIAANSLASGSYGLSDGSKAGDWRLPNIRELHSLVSYGPIPVGPPFTGNVFEVPCWSSTTYNWLNFEWAWIVKFYTGEVVIGQKIYPNMVWCVRGGK